MDNARLILLFALGLVSLSLYQAWQEDYAAKAPQTTTSTTTAIDETSAVPAPSPVADDVSVEGDVPWQ